jgi:hypothetical protein
MTIRFRLRTIAAAGLAAAFLLAHGAGTGAATLSTADDPAMPPRVVPGFAAPGGDDRGTTDIEPVVDPFGGLWLCRGEGEDRECVKWPE